MDIKRAICLVVKGEFMTAAENFNVNPSTDAWANLMNAMWARQAISSPETLDRAATQLENVGVGHWVKHLRKIHEGKAQ